LWKPLWLGGCHSSPKSTTVSSTTSLIPHVTLGCVPRGASCSGAGRAAPFVARPKPADDCAANQCSAEHNAGQHSDEPSRTISFGGLGCCSAVCGRHVGGAGHDCALQGATDAGTPRGQSSQGATLPCCTGIRNVVLRRVSWRSATLRGRIAPSAEIARRVRAGRYGNPTKLCPRSTSRPRDGTTHRRRSRSAPRAQIRLARVRRADHCAPVRRRRDVLLRLGARATGTAGGRDRGSSSAPASAERIGVSPAGRSDPTRRQPTAGSEPTVKRPRTGRAPTDRVVGPCRRAVSCRAQTTQRIPQTY
jgi:hypothetical protein